jgi:hypothetical protein
MAIIMRRHMGRHLGYPGGMFDRCMTIPLVKRSFPLRNRLLIVPVPFCKIFIHLNIGNKVESSNNTYRKKHQARYLFLIRIIMDLLSTNQQTRMKQ